MRVLHVDPETGWGGGEAQVAYLLRELARRGHESILVAPAAAPLARRASALGATVVDCRIANHADVRRVGHLRALARTVDVIHFHTARAHALAPWMGGVGVRRIVTRRMDYVPRGGLWVRYLYNHAVDRVIAISDGVRAALVAGGVDPARIDIVPSGIDAALFAEGASQRAAVRAEWRLRDEDIVVLVVGVLERRKGHATLIDAAAHIGPASPFRWLLCGAGSAEAELRAHAAARGVPVEFLGFRSDVARCLAGADIVVLPSWQEGLGVAALEAMAAERPVVASRTGGLAEVVIDGTTGWLVPPGDSTALAERLVRLSTDREARRRMGTAGAARVRARYSAAAMADGTLACYLRAP